MTGEDILAYIEITKRQNKTQKAGKTKTTGPDAWNIGNGKYGSISGYFSTWDKVPDSYGDICKKGCFSKSIAERKATGHAFPLLYNHDFNQIIGCVTDIGEDSKGAYFTAEFFPTDRAQEIREIVKTSCLWQFSFAYSTIDEGRVTLPDGSKANELRELSLYEISLVGVPANGFTHVTDIKTTGKKHSPEAARVLAFIDEMKKKDNPEAEISRLRDIEAKLLSDYGFGGSCQSAERKRYFERRLKETKAEIARLKELIR